MLFLQGTRDALANIDLITNINASPSQKATLHVVGAADHTFHLLVRLGRNDAQVQVELLDHRSLDDTVVAGGHDNPCVCIKKTSICLSKTSLNLTDARHGY